MVWWMLGAAAAKLTSPMVLAGMLAVILLQGWRLRLVGAAAIGAVLSIWMPLSANAFRAQIGWAPMTAGEVVFNAVVVFAGLLAVALLANWITSARRRQRRD